MNRGFESCFDTRKPISGAHLGMPALQSTHKHLILNSRREHEHCFDTREPILGAHFGMPASDGRNNVHALDAAVPIRRHTLLHQKQNKQTTRIRFFRSARLDLALARFSLCHKSM